MGTSSSGLPIVSRWSELVDLTVGIGVWNRREGESRVRKCRLIGGGGSVGVGEAGWTFWQRGGGDIFRDI